MNKQVVTYLFTIFALVLVSIYAFCGISNQALAVYQPEGITVQTASSAQITRDNNLELQPHPILSDLRVRRAIAYCTNKDALIAAAYPLLTPSERLDLISETSIHPSSWAYSEPATIYAYNPATGISLLEDADWLLPPSGEIRTKAGRELVLTVKSTTADIRLAFLPVFESQMRACGIRVIRDHQENLDWAQYRDFEMAEYAWMFDEQDPGAGLYACDQVPSPENDWTGQNFTGWCNLQASDAIQMAVDLSLSQEVRKEYYAIFIDEFAEDLPVLPLFFREGMDNFWEHIDLNLETYSQEHDLSAAGTGSTGLTFLGFQGNEHIASAPAGVVTQTITLRFDPLVTNSHPIPEHMVVTNAFRMNALLAGVPQDEFVFSEPLTLTIHYNPEQSANHLVESSLDLYAWDDGSGEWWLASESCPQEERYKMVDDSADRLIVRVCHLSEFGLFGRGGEMVRMGVNYGLDEAHGMYEIGHTFSITVTDSVGTLKASATVLTEEGGTGPDFTWSDGFLVEQDDWSDSMLDIVPGDRVYFQSDDGFSDSIQVGTITAQLNPSQDNAIGTVIAPEYTGALVGFAGYWGWFWTEFSVDPAGEPFYVDFSPHDLEPDAMVTVGYQEPDLDHVINVFRTPQHKIYLPLTVSKTP